MSTATDAKPAAPTIADKAKAAAERLEKITALRRSGMTLQQVGQQVGLSAQRVAQLLDEAARSAAQRRREIADEALMLALDRLDACLRSAFAVLHNAELPASQRLRAIDRIVNIEKRRAALLALDAPSKYALTDPSGQKPWTPAVTDEQRVEALAVLLARHLEAGGEDA
jgi:hypothetical protein